MRAYMKPSTRPSMTTWGRMPMTSCQSTVYVGKVSGREQAREGPPADRKPLPASEISAAWLLLLGRRRRDLHPLHGLVVVPLLGDLDHEVDGLLGVTLVVELDVAGDPAVLHLPDRRGDGLAGRRLPARILDGGLQALQADGGRVVGLGRERLRVLAELLLELVGEL